MLICTNKFRQFPAQRIFLPNAGVVTERVLKGVHKSITSKSNVPAEAQHDLGLYHMGLYTPQALHIISKNLSYIWFSSGPLFSSWMLIGEFRSFGHSGL